MDFIYDFIAYASRLDNIVPIIGCILGALCGAVIGHYQVYNRLNTSNTLASDINPEYTPKKHSFINFHIFHH